MRRREASMRRLRDALTPGGTFTGEKFRGAVASAASGSVAGALNILGTSVMGLNPLLSAAVFLYGTGSVIGYTADILFAKRHFRLPGGSDEVVVPYADLGVRAKWLARSFLSKKFYRYLVTVLLDTLVGLAVLRALIDLADRKRWLQDKKKWRDAGFAIFVALFTFFLYNNILRFDWAYRDSEEPIMNLVVLFWATMVLMIYAVTYKPSTGVDGVDGSQNWVIRVGGSDFPAAAAPTDGAAGAENNGPNGAVTQSESSSSAARAANAA